MFYRGLLGALRWIIGFVPVVLLGYWGGAFLSNCFLTLLNPSVPLVFTYVSPTGPMTLRAETFNVDLNNPTVIAEKLTLRGPHGDLLAGASLLRISPAHRAGASALSLTTESTPIAVQVSRPYAKLTRDANGKIALEEYLPKSEGPTSKRPYEVTIEEGVADVVDRVGGKPWRTRVSVPRANISGVGKLWATGGSVDISGIGAGHIRAQGEDGAAKINLEGQNLRLTNLYQHLSQTDLKDNVKGISLGQVYGKSIDLSVFIQRDHPLTLRGEATGEVQGTRVSEFAPTGTVEARLAFQSQTFGGDVTFTAPGSNVNWHGAVQWGPTLLVRGKLDATAAGASVLTPVSRKLLQGADFRDGRFSGVLAFSRPEGPALSGSVSATSAVASGETLRQVHGVVCYYKSDVVAALGQAIWTSGNAQAWVRVDPNRSITGAVALRHADLAQIGSHYHLKDLSGHGEAFAIISGSTQRPLVALTSQGTGEFTNQNEHFHGVFGVAASLNGDRVHLDRATWDGASGKLLASGDISATGTLNVGFDAFGLDLSAAHSEVVGLGAAKGHLSGTLQSPRVSGRAEAYDFGYQTYRSPLAVADFSSDLKRFDLRNIRLASGQGLVEGAAGLRLKDRALTGELMAEALQPSDFGFDTVAGVFDVNHLLLSGSLSQPTISGVLTSADLVCNGVNARDLSAKISYSGGNGVLRDFFAHIGSGTISGNALVNLKDKDGTASFVAKSIPLSSIPATLTKNVRLDGTLDAESKIEIHAGKPLLLSLRGSTEGLSFNRVLLGSGDFDLRQSESKLVGSAEIGSLERYLRAQDIAYDTATKNWSMNLVAGDLDLQNLYQLGQPYLPASSEEAARKLSQVAGNLSLDAHVQSVGNKDPEVEVKTLELSSLAYAGSSLGKIEAKGSKKSSLLDVSDFTWIQGDSTMTLKGTADLKGELNLNGEISKFNFANLGLFQPSLSSLAGEATISFLASGKTQAPEVVASLDSNRVKVVTGAASSVDFGLDISELHLIPGQIDAEGKQQGQIDASGTFNYRGIGGKLEAKAPFAYPFEFPENKPLEASVSLDEQQISVFKELLPSLDTTRSKGTIAGGFKVSGPVNALRATGGINASASSLVMNGSNTSLKDAAASLTFTDDTLLLSANATSSAGGSLNGLIQSKMANFADVVEAIGAGQTAELLKSPLSGALDFLNFKFNEGGKDSTQASGTLASHLDFGGTLRRPAISGNARLLDSLITMGGTAGAPSPVPEYAVNPVFDIDLALDPSRVRASTAQLTVSGGGHLGGSLQKPDMTADMNLINGSIRLPGAKVNLDPGGTMKLTYRTGQDGLPDARLDVARQGHTAVTAARAGGTAQRYDITIDVSGNLLEDNGLTQNASSDPPDLSQDRILALLGQTQLLEAFAGQTGSGYGDAQKQVRDALTGYALPVALDPITSRIADRLGLDYLTVEYNPFDLTTITFARALNKSFILQGRRQIGEPAPEHRPIADLQLIYRLPVRRGLLNRVSFSIGIDQDRPWKASLQYSSRF